MILFRLGVVVATPGALEVLAPEEALMLLRRHASGDWGEVNSHDHKANQQALRTGARLLSAYTAASGERVWIITEAVRSSTTILLPEEY